MSFIRKKCEQILRRDAVDVFYSVTISFWAESLTQIYL